MEPEAPSNINSDSMDYKIKHDTNDDQDEPIRHQDTQGERVSEVVTKRLPWGAILLTYLPPFKRSPRYSYGILVWTLTFLTYLNYYMTRKVFSAVKSQLAPNCSRQSCSIEESDFLHSWEFDEQDLPKNHCNSSSENACSADEWTGWAPFDNNNYCQTLLGSVDYSWLFAYAIFMFISGMIADRVNLRYFLTFGLIGSGIATCLMGMAEFAGIHQIYYFILMQLLNGILQSTGWPGLVAILGNWFGKARRGFLMGLWSSNSSLGSILGTIIPAALLNTSIGCLYCFRWGLSFVVPGVIMIIMGVIVFLFLVVDPTDVGLTPPKHHDSDEPKANGVSGVSSPFPINSVLSPLSDDDSSPVVVDNYMYSKEANLNNNNTQPPLTDDEGKRAEPNKETTPKSSILDYIVNSSPYRIVIGGKEDGAIGFVGALMIPGVIEFSLSLFFTKLVTFTFLFWLPFYVNSNGIDGKCISSELSDYISTVFNVGGVFGGILAGLFSDWTNARAITCVAFLYTSVPVLYLYRILGSLNIPLAIIMLLVTGFFVNAPYAMSSAVCSDLGTHKSLQNSQRAMATVSAIINGTGSIGAAFGPLLTGWISDQFGWDSVFYLLMVSCFLSALLLTRLLINESRRFIKKYIYSDFDQMCCGRYFFRK